MQRKVPHEQVDDFAARTAGRAACGAGKRPEGREHALAAR